MKCENRLDQLIALDSGGLSPRDETEIRRHVRECDVCSRRLEQIQAMGSRISDSLAQPEAVPDITESVMRRVQPRRVAVWPWAVAAAFACLLLVVLVNRPATKQPRVVKTPRQIAAPTVVQHPTPEPEVRQQPAPRPQWTVAKRTAVKHTRLRPRHTELARRSHREPETAVTVCVEVGLEGNTRRTTIATGDAEHVVQIQSTPPVETPPDPELAGIERPALRTIVRADPTAMMSDQM